MNKKLGFNCRNCNFTYYIELTEKQFDICKIPDCPECKKDFLIKIKE